ncbi:MAG: phosphodiester glycosidase family protein [Lachnospiraceae bacterium]|nr:phosphodiester glycosidase family protein [Lachnospiraceae bacterium]
MKTRFHKTIFAVAYGTALTAFTGYAALDTFVIPKQYAVVEAREEAAVTPDEVLTEEADGNIVTMSEVDTEGASVVSSYEDESMSITIYEYETNDTAVYVADVRLSSPEYLQTALAGNTYGRNVTANTSEIADDADAILAINGDFYGSRNAGYVIRNGVLYRDTAERDREDLVIYEDGSFAMVSENDVSAQELLAQGAVQVLSFGPALLADGEIQVSETEEVGKAKASNPRTAIGIVGDLHYVFVVSDGRTDASEGLSLHELAAFLRDIGVAGAYNLDGGGSSTMVFRGEVVNNPTTRGNRIKERAVSDIVYIGGDS